MKKALAAAVAMVVFASFAAFAAEIDFGTVQINNSTVVTMDIEGTPYGGAMGTVTLRLGTFEWSADEIWLLPANASADDFSYTGKTYRVPGGLNLTNDCVTSIYELNNTRAFKATVKEGGTFCVLADPGTYHMVAEY